MRVRWYQAGNENAQNALPLVLVHGAGASADTWIRNLEALALDRMVYAPDLVGHGLSDGKAHKGQPPQQLQVDHLKALIEHWGIDRFAMAGSSFGALVASLTCLELGPRSARLVLIGSASTFHPGLDQADILQGVLKNQLSALHSPTPDAIRKRNVGSNFDKNDTFEEIVVCQMSSLAMPGRSEFFTETINGLIATANDPNWRVHDRLDQLTMPTLVISGQDDPRADPDQVRKSASKLADCQVHILPRCGHKPFSEQPDVFNTLVAQFLGQES